ncbi:MAG: serine hydrolase domain-containing protein [Caulobacteraceae bacterium]
MAHLLTRRSTMAALVSCAACAPARLAADNDRLDATLRETRTAHNLPGLAAAVVLGDAIVAVGVDDVRQVGTTDRITHGDRFHIASCTKSMTATLAAIAVRSGAIDWTTSLEACLPDLAAVIRADYRSATLEQLLAHAARMPTYTQPSAERVAWMHGLQGAPVVQRTTFLREVLAPEEPNLATGDGAYSNVGYVAAGAMLERATGAAWEDLIHRELAAPIGWRSVGFGYPATAASPHQPRGHGMVDGQIQVLPMDPARDLATCLYPAGAVHLSIADFASYARDHLNGLRGRRALLPPELYAKLHTQLPGATGVFTLGWGVREDEELGRLHFGAGSGGWFFARIWIAPERDMAVAALSNSGDAALATRDLTLRLFSEYAA